jgi:hypothetical protein
MGIARLLMVFLSTSTGIAKFFTKKLLAWEQRAKKSISSPIFCPSNFPT